MQPLKRKQAYISALQSAAGHRLAADRLEYYDAAGRTTLTFVRQEQVAMDPAALVDTSWQLANIDGEPPIVGSTITLEFLSGIELAGYAGCRHYTGGYEARGDDFTLMGLFAMQEMDCVKPKAFRWQEGAYTTHLEEATDYRLSDGKLELLTAPGAVLGFVPLTEQGAAAEVEKTVWVLAAFIEEGITTPVSPEANITLSFERDTVDVSGTVQGTAGCGSYQAAYLFDGSFLAFGPATRESSCDQSPDVAEPVQRYLDTRKLMTVYRIEGDELRLETSDGRALILTTGE